MLPASLFTVLSTLSLFLGACSEVQPSSPPTAAVPPAAAAPAPEPTVERQLLILTGGTDAATVRQWMARHTAPLTELYGSTPPLPVLQSDGIEGLKPGFFILAPAVCSKEEASEAFYAALHEIPGSYVRTVQVPEDFGTCRRAKTTDWWVLRMSESGDLCSLWREKLEPAEEVYVGDPNVIPPPPPGTEDLQYLDGPCPRQWSAVASDTSPYMLIHDHTTTGLRGAERVHLLELDGADGGAERIEPGVPFESATFDGAVPVVHFIDRSVPQVPPDAPPDAQVEIVYDGSLAGLFAAAGQADRPVTGAELSEVRQKVPGDAIEVLACVSARWEGGTWVEQSRHVAAVLEGSLPPYCTNRRPMHNLGFRDSSLKGQSVSQSLGSGFNQAAGAPESTQWHFVGMSGVGKGDLAVSTHTEIGSNLTGYAVAWDGQTARPLEELKGRLTNVRDLDHGRVLVCTDKGHGAFQSRTGRQLWWTRGIQCPVVFVE